MTIRISTTLLALILAGTLAAPAVAADKEQRQMMADLRILQEQSQQLQNLIATLSESVRAVGTRLEQQAEVSRKSFADQKLVIDNVSADLRVLKEKVDDNNVRVGSLGQELDALRQSVASLNVSRPFGQDADGLGGGNAGDPVVGGGTAAVGASPQKLLDGAMADYYGGNYDLAIAGLDSYIKAYPQSPQADYAQYHVGRSFMQQGKYDRAIEAYEAVAKNYPKSGFIAEAYAAAGVSYKTLRQNDKAREAFEFVIKNYPDSTAATIARQNLTTTRP
ncbi:MAG: tetratricopeptide repeat protein [Vicinamibacterales bacterium]